MKMKIDRLAAMAIFVLSISPALVLMGDGEKPFDAYRALYDHEWTYPADPVASNIYSRARSLYAGDPYSLFDKFLSVRCGGIMMEMGTLEFLDFAAYVSNHFSDVVADWRMYETNEVVRWTTLSAAGYSGFGNMTNLACKIIDEYNVNTNYCSLDTVNFLTCPSGTPLEKYMILNYDAPDISNAVEILKVKASQRGDTNEVDWCDRVLSGNEKREYLELKAAGYDM